VLTVEPFLRHNYRASFRTAGDDKPRCLETLGFDVVLDGGPKPWVIEVNHLPSLACDSAFHGELKDAVITGAPRAHRASERSWGGKKAPAANDPVFSLDRERIIARETG